MNLKIELLQLKLAAKFDFKISEYPSLFIVLLRETDFSTILRLQRKSTFHHNITFHLFNEQQDLLRLDMYLLKFDKYCTLPYYFNFTDVYTS